MEARKIFQRRIISVLLVFCMLITFIPIIDTPSYAAGTNALEAMGIDTSKAPEGFDITDTSNPYGKDSVTLNPVEEIHVFGLETNSDYYVNQKLNANDYKDGNGNYPSEITVPFTEWSNPLLSKLYGHDDYIHKTTSSIMDNGKEETISASTTSGSGYYRYIGGTYIGYYLQSENFNINNTLISDETIAATKIAKGNFDGNEEGKTIQNVLLYTGDFSQDGGLYMKIGNAVEIDENNLRGYGNKFTLIPTTKTIGNPKDKIADVTEDFATNPYLMNNYLQVTTGDFDGNGIDEIAVFIPEYNGSKIVVYRLKSITGGADYKNPSHWEIGWTYPLYETGYVSNMVSLVAGDFNKDGIDDLGATWGYYYGPDNNRGSKAVVQFGAKGKMLEKAQVFSLEFDHPSYGKSDIVRGSFIFGDLFGGGQESLVLGGQSAADIEHGNINSRYVAIYTWNGTSFQRNIDKNFDLFEKTKDEAGNITYTYPIMKTNRADDIFYSVPSNPANLAIAKQGLTDPPYLYLDSLQIQSSDAGLDLIAPLDLANQPVSANPQYYVEYGVSSGDLLGLGYETVITMQQTLPRIENIGEIPPIGAFFESWIHKLYGISWHYPASNYVPKFIPGKAYYNVMDFHKEEDSEKAYYKKTLADYTTSVCMQNTDDDTSYLQYTNKHYFRYSDPQVLAVLASPPYFSDLLDRDDLSGSYGESSTSYSSTKGTGGSDTFNTTIEAGAYVGFEHDFEVFGVKVASVEAELAITAGFTYEMEESSMLEQTVTYTTVAGQDTVAFFSIPLEIYEYTAFLPDGKGSYDEQTMSVSIPRTANVVTLSLEDYENIAKDYDELPQISDSILTHTPGNPFTYSTSQSGYKQPLVYDGEWSGVKFSDVGASISQEIAMTEETAHSYNFFGKIETKAGAGVGDFKAGITVGVELGGGWVDVSTSGNSFSGEIFTMPAEAEPYGYGYNWKVFSYLYDNNGIQFPVVSYLVNDVVAPPPLPDDFAQNVEKTTDSEIALTWTYDRMVAGFQIYRYYEFPDGSGSYEHQFISMDQGELKNGVYEFEFIDDNLSPYSDYDYQIQTVRASAPNNSIPSEVLEARTKTSHGYPEYELKGDFDDEGYLRIYPDSQSTVKVIVENADDYPEGISYQWQKLEDGKWGNIKGQEKDSLTFASSGVADQARYRCRTNVIYYDEAQGNNYYISSYSPEFSTIYSRRIPIVDDFEALYIKSDGKLDLKLILKSGNTGHNTAPSGNVTFTVKGTDYNTAHTVGLGAAGSEGNKLLSKATIQIANLADGVYEIEAYYGGDRIFGSLTTDTITSLVGDSGYLLNLENSANKQSQSFIYGDTIKPILKEFDGTNQDGIEVSEDITYSYQYIDREFVQILPGWGYYRPIIKTVDITLSEYGRFNTPNLGAYTLIATLDDGTSIERDFSVGQRKITIKAVDESIGAGNVSTKPPKIELDESTPMAFEEGLETLNLGIIARNTADKLVELNNETDPGNYTIIGSPTIDTPADKYNNYKVTFVEATYTIVGSTFYVTMEALPYQGRAAGTIELSVNNRAPYENEKFSASTALLFIARPYESYEVDKWAISTGDIDITDFTELTPNIISYILKSEDTHVEVSFKKAETILDIIKEGEGSVAASDPAFVSGALVGAGAEIDFTATADEGYTFKEWRIESGSTTKVENGILNDDGSNTLNFTMGASSTRLNAIFIRDSYRLNLSGNLEAAYEYEDIVGNKLERVVGDGASIVGDTEVTVRLKAGYALAEGAQWLVNGEEVEVADPNIGYKFNIEEETTVEVDTVLQHYSLTTVADNGSISVKIDDSSPIISDGIIEDVAGGSRLIFTASPAHGYAFYSFTVIGTSNYTVKDNVLTINELGADLTVQANFIAVDPYNISVTYGDRATMTYTLYDSYGVQVDSGEITIPGGIINVYEGDKIKLDISPDTGYMVDKWIVDGLVDDTSNRSKTLEGISKNMVVLIDIIPQVSYTVTYGVGNEGGSIIGATTDGREFVSGDIDVGGNSWLEIIAEPVDGQMVSIWTFNGEVIKNDMGGDYVGKTLIIEKLRSDKPTVDIKVFFEETEGFNIPISGSYENYSIIEVEKIPDDVSFEGNKIRKNGTLVFTVSPDDGYYIKELQVNEVDCINGVSKQTSDGSMVSAIEVDGVYTITIENVTADIECLIEAAKPVINITPSTNGTITVSDINNIPITDGEEVPAGAELTLKAVANSGYRLSSWGDFASGKSGNEIKLTVPQGDFTVSASYVKSSPDPGPSPSPSPGPGILPSTRYTIDTIVARGGSISPKSATVDAGGSQVFTIAADEGFEIKDVLVNGTSLGALSTYTFKDVSKNSTIEAIFTELELKPDPSINFIDVDDDDWFADSVEFVVDLGLFKGTSEDEFSPYLSMTRGMFVTVLGRLYEYMEDLTLPQAEEVSFDDVPLDMYYASSVQWASENGIVKGYEDGKFRPDEPITREQIVALVHRFALHTGLDTSKTSDLGAFTDGSAVSEWALDAMGWAVDSEIIGGRADGSIDPLGLAQRAEVAAIIHRLILNLID